MRGLDPKDQGHFTAADASARPDDQQDLVVVGDRGINPYPASRILADWDDTTAVAGTNVVYVATHHFGNLRRGIPARPFLGVSTDSRDTVLQTIVDHLQR